MLIELNKIKNPEKIHLETLKKWIHEKESEVLHKSLSYSFTVITLIVGVLAVCAIVFLYHKYKRTKRSPSPVREEE